MGIDIPIPMGKVLGMADSNFPSLRKFLNSIPPPEQEEYALRCGTTIGYLRKKISAGGKLGESLSIALDRESSGKVRFDDLCPDVDWAYVRKSSRSFRLTTNRKCG